MKSYYLDAQDSRVLAHTRWRYISNYRDLQQRSGVYIFANSDLQVKYIGKAGAYRMVKEIANAIHRRKANGATKLRVLYTNSGEKATSLETYLIKKYRPVNNHTY